METRGMLLSTSVCVFGNLCNKKKQHITEFDSAERKKRQGGKEVREGERPKRREGKQRKEIPDRRSMCLSLRQQSDSGEATKVLGKVCPLPTSLRVSLLRGIS